ncbi:MAG TPA: FHA domain-containing protein [Fimbriiglobus sp.]|nr:FHA domain-containing protein [Fimbriiglobus sp.]
MKFVLIAARGKHRGMPIPVEVDLFLIGSDHACQLRSHHPDVGRQHCALVTHGERVFVRDLGSGKPTRVNDRPMPPGEEWPLHKGDLLVVGPLAFKVSFHERPLSKRDMDDWALRVLDEDTGPKKPVMQELAEVEGRPFEYRDPAAEAAAAMLSQFQAMKGVVRGRLHISRESGVTVVGVNEVYLVEPAELSLLKKELQDNLAGRNLRVLLDLKTVRRMSSAAVNLFGELAGWLRERGSCLAFCRLRPDLAGMLYDLESVFHFRVFADKADALAARW